MSNFCKSGAKLIGVLAFVVLAAQCQSVQTVSPLGSAQPLSSDKEMSELERLHARRIERARLFQLYEKLARIDQVELTKGDVDRVAALRVSEVEPSQLTQAILVLAGAQAVLKNRQQMTGFKDVQVDEDDQEGALSGALESRKKDWSGADSLEEYVDSRGIELAEELRTNRFLKKFEVQLLVQSALKVSQEQDESFVRDTSERLASNIDSLYLQAQRLGFFGTASRDGERIHESDLEIESGTRDDLFRDQNGIAAALPYNPASFGKDEEKLKQADALMMEGRFKESIALLKILSESEFYRSTAEQKIIEASDAAVKKLRHQAAVAFKKVKPVNDLNTRKAYLEDVKKLLASAIEDFPESSQLDTVKNNLTIIERNISVLEQQVLSDSDVAP